MDILERAIKVFSKVHYTHLTLSYQASGSLTNDPNRAKSIVELSQLSSDCVLQCSDCRTWFKSLPKKKNKNYWPSSKLVQTLGPATTLHQSLFFYLCFMCLGKCARACSLLCTHPTSKSHMTHRSGLPIDSQAQGKEPVGLHRAVHFRPGDLLYRADGISMGWGN